ncbi:MAG: maleylpyruvate isomerase N-terminal domain-containing protein [Mycobacteriales bacterium]
MTDGAVRAAFAAEAAELARVMLGLEPAVFDRPTRCRPWSVADLLAHVRTAIGRLVEMLAAPPPDAAEVDAAGYYRPDRRFEPDVDAARVAAAIRDAAEAGGPALARDFDRTWREVAALVAAEPPGQLVTTRHGDPMTLTDFLVTRVVELVVHGLDLADGLGVEPWTTEPGAAVVQDLLRDAGGREVAEKFGWDGPELMRKATGRTPLTGVERRYLAEHPATWLAFG